MYNKADTDQKADFFLRYVLHQPSLQQAKNYHLQSQELKLKAKQAESSLQESFVKRIPYKTLLRWKEQKQAR